MTRVVGGGGVPALMTGWVWRFVGSATAGTEVLVWFVDGADVVVDDPPLAVVVWVVPDAGFEAVVEVVLCDEVEGVLPQAARRTAKATGEAMRSRRTGEENRS